MIPILCLTMSVCHGGLTDNQIILFSLYSFVLLFRVVFLRRGQVVPTAVLLFCIPGRILCLCRRSIVFIVALFVDGEPSSALSVQAVLPVTASIRSEERITISVSGTIWRIVTAIIFTSSHFVAGK